MSLLIAVHLQYYSSKLIRSNVFIGVCLLFYTVGHIEDSVLFIKMYLTDKQKLGARNLRDLAVTRPSTTSTQNTSVNLTLMFVPHLHCRAERFCRRTSKGRKQNFAQALCWWVWCDPTHGGCRECTGEQANAQLLAPAQLLCSQPGVVASGRTAHLISSSMPQVSGSKAHGFPRQASLSHWNHTWPSSSPLGLRDVNAGTATAVTTRDKHQSHNLLWQQGKAQLYRDSCTLPKCRFFSITTDRRMYSCSLILKFLNTSGRHISIT